MGTIGTTYIICGFLYIIACVMDGHDVKPLWKKWVGGKLEKAANYFFPIKYVTETKVKYLPIEPPTPFERCDYDRINFDGKKIKATGIITEQDMLDALSPVSYRMDEAVPRLIRERKSRCIHAICDKIANGEYITVEVDRETQYPSILVSAWVYVGKKRKI